jgi:ankyrin repeat protein
MARKKTNKQAATTLVQHRSPDLAALLERAKRGKKRDVKLYLDAGGSANALVSVSFEGNLMTMPLLHAVVMLNLLADVAESVELLVQAGADVHSVRIDHVGSDSSALLTAAACSHSLRALLRCGADPCFKSRRYGFTALHMAAMASAIENCKALIAADQTGQLISTVDHLHWTALHIAAQHGHGSVVAYLISQGLDPNVVDKRGLVPIHGAAQKGHVEAVKVLLQYGADPAIRSKEGVNAMVLAAGNSRLKVVDLLVKHGVSLVVTWSSGTTLLMQAARMGDLAVAEYLLAKHVAVNAEDEKGITALHYAASLDDTKKAIVKLLLASGANVNKLAQASQTPLRMAADTGSVEIAKLLLAAGADHYSGTQLCLHIAVDRQHTAMVKLLLEHGANAMINDMNYICQCCGRMTTLMMATDAATVKLLLAAGADVHKVTSTGNTVLHVAAAHNYAAPVICLLIKAGADLHAKNAAGVTAADVAKAKRHTLIEQLLNRAAQQEH